MATPSRASTETETPGPDQARQERRRGGGSLHTILVAAGVVIIALALWQLVDVVLLLFAAVLFAVMLRSLARPIERYARIPEPWSLIPAMLGFAAVVAAFLFLLGTRIHAEVAALSERLPELLATLGERLGVENLRERLTGWVEDIAGSGIIGSVAGYTTSALGALGSMLLVIAAGLYLAARPQQYRRGILRLTPPRVRGRAAEVLDATGDALRMWLLGQLISMVSVGLLTTAGLFAIGMPSALGLGFLAGVAEFVPYIGPFLAAIPAILLALSEGGSMVYWVLGLYLVIQQIEGNVIMPLVQRRAVNLPAVLTLFAVLAFGILFGVLGILLAAPLTVVVYVLVKELYIRDALEDADAPDAR